MVRMTCSVPAIAKRPCLISISCQRRYFVASLPIRPSGSHTPSGLVVPMSPGEIAAMRIAERGAR